MTSSISKGRVTVPGLQRFKDSGKKITALTAYDFTMARILDQAGVDLILVGDSLASIIQGEETTLPVTLDQMAYHCRCVSRAVSRALVIGDMPFLSFQPSAERAIEAAGKLLKEGGVAGVKVEGGVHIAETISRLVQVDIPVVGHVGLTPQSYHRMGGHKLQGKERLGSEALAAGSRERIKQDAISVEEAGAFALVIEGVPAELAGEITEMLSIPTIGIGAGPACNGQILVTHDMLGLNPDFKPKFVKRYNNLFDLVTASVVSYCDEVRGEQFPSIEHTATEKPKQAGLTGAALRIASGGVKK